MNQAVPATATCAATDVLRSAASHTHGLRLTPRDQAIIEMLTQRTRVITATQAARMWWKGSPAGTSQAYRRFKTLCHLGYLRAVEVSTRPELDLTCPVMHWSPINTTPEFHEVAHTLSARWTEKARKKTAFVATARMASVLGGHAWADEHADAVMRRWMNTEGPRRVGQATHDVHVTEVYLHAARSRPFVAEHWLLEGVQTAVDRSSAIEACDATIYETTISGQRFPTLAIAFGDDHDAA